MYYFLKDDFDELNDQILKICDKIREIGQEMGSSCKEGAETFHDNFAYEDGERQQFMWSKRLRELIGIRNNARVISDDQVTDSVSLGRTVTIRDEISGETQIAKIGSYMVLKCGEMKTISYNSPLARILIGAKVGEKKEGFIGGKKRGYSILKIE